MSELNGLGLHLPHGLKVAAFLVKKSGESETRAIEADGSIGLTTAGQIRIYTTVQSGCSLFGFVTNGAGDITRKNPETKAGKARFHYLLKVSIVTQAGGPPRTIHPQNTLKFLRVLRNGIFEIWDLAGICQNGQGFVTCQRISRNRCYSFNGKILCPDFSGNPEMMRFLNQEDIVLAFGQSAPSEENYLRLQEPMVSAEGLSDTQGRVIWFNQARGLGALATTSGPMLAHWSKLLTDRPETKRRILLTGEVVKISATKNLPHQGGDFVAEAIGISLA